MKNLPISAVDMGSILGSERSPGEGNGSPLQYSCLENPMGIGPSQATVHEVAKSLTRLNDSTASGWVQKFWSAMTKSKVVLVAQVLSQGTSRTEDNQSTQSSQASLKTKKYLHNWLHLDRCCVTNMPLPELFLILFLNKNKSAETKSIYINQIYI